MTPNDIVSGLFKSLDWTDVVIPKSGAPYQPRPIRVEKYREKGREAKLAGHPITACPFYSDLAKVEAWEAGWSEA